MTGAKMNSVNQSSGDRLARKVASIYRFPEAHQEQRTLQSSLRPTSTLQRLDYRLMVLRGLKEGMSHPQKKKVNKILVRFSTRINTKMIT